jgi:uncharacterized membrane protein YhaH (DUF805 family)
LILKRHTSAVDNGIFSASCKPHLWISGGGGRRMGVVRVLLGFRGRLSRAEFTVLGIVLGLIQEVLSLIAVSLVEWRHPDRGELEMAGLTNIARYAVIIAFLWPMLAMTVKRYHDLDKSGWWACLLVAPIVLGIVGVLSYMDDAKNSGIIVGALAVMAFVWPIIELGFFRGSPGDNAYGPRLRWQDLFPGMAKGSAQSHQEAVTSSARAPVANLPSRLAAPVEAVAAQRRSSRSPAATNFGQRTRPAR